MGGIETWIHDNLFVYQPRYLFMHMIQYSISIIHKPNFSPILPRSKLFQFVKSNRVSSI